MWTVRFIHESLHHAHTTMSSSVRGIRCARWGHMRVTYLGITYDVRTEAQLLALLVYLSTQAA